MDAERSNAQTVNDLSRVVIGHALTVAGTLGSGFFEKVYETALVHELRKAKIPVRRQYGMKIWYDGIVAGEYVADLLVANTLLVELKAARTLDPIYHAQCTNYLKATGLNLCLLLNFGSPKLQIKRVVNGI